MKDNTREERRSRALRRRPFDANGAVDSATPPHLVKQSKAKRRLWLFLLLCLVGSTAASFIIFKYIAPTVIAPSIPSELVGTWQVTDGTLKGATLEFTWHGTAIATSEKNGIKDETNSAVKLEGKRIFLTTQDSRTRKADTVVQTIVNLSENELVIRDEDKNTYNMTRVRR